MTSNTAVISSGSISVIRGVRCGRSSISPSDARTLNASRSGVRDTPKLSHNIFSGSAEPGRSSLFRIISRSFATNWSCSECRCRICFGGITDSFSRADLKRGRARLRVAVSVMSISKPCASYSSVFSRAAHKSGNDSLQKNVLSICLYYKKCVLHIAFNLAWRLRWSWYLGDPCSECSHEEVDLPRCGHGFARRAGHELRARGGSGRADH